MCKTVTVVTLSGSDENQWTSCHPDTEDCGGLGILRECRQHAIQRCPFMHELKVTDDASDQ